MTHTQEYLNAIQHLRLANDLFEDFCPPDIKCIHVRKGYRTFRLGDLLFVSTDPVEKNIDWDTYIELNEEIFKCQLVSVSEVIHKWFGDVTNEEAQDAGYMNTLSWYFGLRCFYPTLDENSEITLIKFNVR